MINPRIFREAENASSNFNAKPLTAEQKLPKMKAKALGDVQNTLHSRPANFLNPSRTPSAKASSKSSAHVKATTDEHGLTVKNTPSGNKLFLTPSKSALTSTLSTPVLDDVMPELHDHTLCEPEEESYVNMYFKEYRFSDEQIKNLVHSVKVSRTPVSYELYEPCEDIEIPVDKFQEKSFSNSDIFNDVILPPVPPPLMAL